MTTPQHSHRRILRHLQARAIVLCIIASHIFSSSPSIAREVFAEDGVVIATAGQIDEFGDHTLLKVGITIPQDAYVYLTNEHSLEFFLPCKGWVPDEGILVIDGCIEERRAGDTLNGPIALTTEMGCDKMGSRVILLVRIPRMFIKSDCRPTQARWAGGYYSVEE